MTEIIENIDENVVDHIEDDDIDQNQDDQDATGNSNVPSKSTTPSKKKGKAKKLAKGKHKKGKDDAPEQPQLTDEQLMALRKKEEKERELQKILEATSKLEFKVAAPEPKVAKPMKFNNYYAKKYGGKTQEELDREEEEREKEKQRLLEEEKKRQQEEEERKKKLEEEEEAKRREEERLKNARDSMIDGSITGRESNATRESVSGTLFGGAKKDSYYMRKYIKQIQEAEEMERKRQQEIKEREIQEQMRKQKEEAERKAEEERLQREYEEKRRLEEEAAEKARQEEEERLRILEEERLRREKFEQQRDERNRSLFNQKTNYTTEEIAKITKEYQEKREKERQAEIAAKQQEMDEIEQKFQQMMLQDELKKQKKQEQIQLQIKQKNQQLQQQELKYLKGRYNEVSNKGVIQELSNLQITVKKIEDIKMQARQLLNSQYYIREMSKFNQSKNQVLKEFEEQINIQKVSMYQQVQEASVIQKVQISVAEDVNSTQILQKQQESLEKSRQLNSTKLNQTANFGYNNIKTQYGVQNTQRQTKVKIVQPKLLPVELTNQLQPSGTQLPVSNLDYQYIQEKNLKQQVLGQFKMYNLMNIYNSKTAEAFMRENNIDSKYKITTFNNVKQKYFAENNIAETDVKSESVKMQIRSTSQQRQHSQSCSNLNNADTKQLSEIEAKGQQILSHLQTLKEQQQGIQQNTEIPNNQEEFKYGLKNYSLGELIQVNKIRESDELFTRIDILNLIVNNINDTEKHKGNSQNQEIIERSLQLISMLNQMLVRALIDSHKANRMPNQQKSIKLTKKELETRCGEKYQNLYKQFVQDINNIELAIFKLMPTPEQIKTKQNPKLTGNELQYDIVLQNVGQLIDIQPIIDDTELIQYLNSVKHKLNDVQVVELTKDNETIQNNLKEVNQLIDLFKQVLIMCKKRLMGITQIPDPENKKKMITVFKQVNVNDEEVSITKKELYGPYAEEYCIQFEKFLEKLKSIEIRCKKAHRLTGHEIQQINGGLQYQIVTQSLNQLLGFGQHMQNSDLLQELDNSIIQLNNVIAAEERKGNRYNDQGIRDCGVYFANVRELLCNVAKQHFQHFQNQPDENVTLSHKQLIDTRNEQAIETFDTLLDFMGQFVVYVYHDPLQSTNNVTSHSQIEQISQNAKKAQEKVLQIQKQICEEQKQFISQQEELKEQERQRQQQLDAKRREEKLRQEEEQRRQKEEQQRQIQEQLRLQKEKIQQQQKLQQEMLLKQQQEAKQRQLEKQRQEQLMKQQAQQKQQQQQLQTSPESEVKQETDHEEDRAGSVKKKKVLKVAKKLKHKPKRVQHDDHIEEPDPDQDQDSVQQVYQQEDDQYALFEAERQAEYEKQLKEQAERQQLLTKKEEDKAQQQQQKLTSRSNKSAIELVVPQTLQIQQTEDNDENQASKEHIEVIPEFEKAENNQQPPAASSNNQIVQPFAVPAHEAQQEAASTIQHQDVLEEDLSISPAAEETSKSQSPGNKKAKKGKMVAKKGKKKQNITQNPFENAEEQDNKTTAIDEAIELFG